MVLKSIDDVQVRREVEAQYEEFRRTGKVRATLGEDDKVVRALHAAEVLKTPLSSLDAKWPREIGSKIGMRAPALPVAKQRRERLPPPELPDGAPKAKPERTAPKFTLDGAAPVEKAPSIGPKTAKRLEAAGVRTIADLLKLEPEAGQRELGARHISAQVIRDWQAQALLACTVPGMKSREAQALVACGVRDAEGLAKADAAELTEAVAQWGLSDEGARAWGSAPAPTADDIATWIERARRAAKTSVKGAEAA
jgi:predicted flap endonuclease-1-like 5' DNA nuclease